MNLHLKRGFTPALNLVSLLVFLLNHCKRIFSHIKNQLPQMNPLSNKNTRPKLVRGFTLIELLVVIAIIGILSSVVLASLNSARAKGADAAVKANLNNMRAQAELSYDSFPNSYAGVCADSNISKGGQAAASAGGGAWVCNQSTAAWAGSTAVKSQNLVNGSSGTDYWCVDSSGTSKLEDSALGAGVFVCP